MAYGTKNIQGPQLAYNVQKFHSPQNSGKYGYAGDVTNDSKRQRPSKNGNYQNVPPKNSSCNSDHRNKLPQKQSTPNKSQMVKPFNTKPRQFTPQQKGNKNSSSHARKPRKSQVNGGLKTEQPDTVEVKAPIAAKSPRRRRQASPPRPETRDAADAMSSSPLSSNASLEKPHQKEYNSSPRNRIASKSISVPNDNKKAFTGTPRKMTLQDTSNTPHTAPSHSHYAGALFNNSPAAKSLPRPPFIFNSSSSPKTSYESNDLVSSSSISQTKPVFDIPSANPFAPSPAMSLTEIFQKLRAVDTV
ncbi:hypothetical protein H4219_000289 [Mycoemilia scoparia]|uniref:Uncharacterized protein n=1 Tax=Mycoemilia scoparia TaxID=417184 RepID=A0A9W8A389_9FUNG|nr:hypothetical protein H4219_000289 [Mycoemilia scoparia]